MIVPFYTCTPITLWRLFITYEQIIRDRMIYRKMIRDRMIYCKMVRRLCVYDISIGLWKFSDGVAFCNFLLFWQYLNGCLGIRIIMSTIDRTVVSVSHPHTNQIKLVCLVQSQHYYHNNEKCLVRPWNSLELNSIHAFTRNIVHVGLCNFFIIASTHFFQVTSWVPYLRK